MTSKSLQGKTSLSIENATIIKKVKKSQEKLGLITQTTHKMTTFRMRVLAIEELDELTKKINKKLNIKLAKGTIVELLILDASRRNLSEVVDIIHKNS
jgi:hypothetical protein